MRSLLFQTGLILLLSLARAADNTLQLTFPPAAPSDFQPHFNYNANVKFTWTSSWPNITLQIYQGPDGQGRNPHVTLLEGVIGVSEYNWQARSLTKFMTRDSPFHLYLFAANNPSCSTCHSNSTEFWIKKNTTTEETGNENGTALKVGLGVGLGVGIPVVASIAGLGVWCCMRRRRREHASRQASVEDWIPPPPPFSSVPGSEEVGESEHKSPVEVEAGNGRPAELHSEAAVAEAPAKLDTRAELEGDSGLDPREMN